ncbi:hypothetical protein [Actinoplanes sp. L3-i22]|uniref:hypothetical protein n=1 Tax=Actinoplanes sp. L3-i22 TaxID=2836373 RepID=UPI001C85F47B|nr:hypothetical protein [Actinoplanes sp. L3-i22]
MNWTGKRTVTGLLVALALGMVAAGIFLLGEHRQRQIIDRGSPTRAIITADHDDELDHWYTVSYTAEGRDRSADLRAPWLIDKMPIGQALTVYPDPGHPEQIVTSNGYATPVWTPAPGWLTVLALLAAFISVIGRLSATRQRRSGG